MPSKGFKMPIEQRLKIGLGNKGKKLSPETITKMKIAAVKRNPARWLIGRKIPPHSIEVRNRISKSRKGKAAGIDNYMWKGDSVGYRAIHNWIVRHYGQPTTCEHCQIGNLTGHNIHWASKTKKYTRDREQWLRLCAKCHKLFDKR